MLDPRIMSPGSIMPSYPWLFDNEVDTSLTSAKIRAMQQLGVPYAKGYDKEANKDYLGQATAIQQNLAKDKLGAKKTSEIIALIAYLQRVGTDIKGEQK
jgi:cytochrome c oxidase cbb3-type subunit I/II